MAEKKKKKGGRGAECSKLEASDVFAKRLQHLLYLYIIYLPPPFFLPQEERERELSLVLKKRVRRADESLTDFLNSANGEKKKKLLSIGINFSLKTLFTYFSGRKKKEKKTAGVRIGMEKKKHLLLLLGVLWAKYSVATEKFLLQL